VIATVLGADRKLPRAIVCANDQTAIGVLHALDQRGIRVPGQVAVTGFDDVAVARHLHPTLTTVRQPIREMGVIAFDLLHAAITGRRLPSATSSSRSSWSFARAADAAAPDGGSRAGRHPDTARQCPSSA